jgi:glycosyltransferase involved in cell wall biosynthesis
MIRNSHIAVVLPAYNAAKTLIETYNEIPMDIVDEVILVDDASIDETTKIAAQLKLQLIVHEENKGYGGNQKSCYSAALRTNADIIIHRN